MRRTLASLASLLCGTALAADLTVSFSATPRWQSVNNGSPYAVALAAAPLRSSWQELSIKLREGGLNADGLLRWQAAEGDKPEQHGVVNQLYYDGDLGEGQGFTFGRKVLSWGVGFGFRPLDVLQREDRRGLNPPPLVGIPLLAWQRFTADEAWTLVLANPHRTGSPSADKRALSFAANWYRLSGDTDLHGVARLSARQRLEVGGGFARTFGDAWSIHGAALYLHRYAKSINALAESGGFPLAAADPLHERFQRSGMAAVLGVQWTAPDGLGILVEAWRDPIAYSHDEWKQLDGLAARQLALSGSAPQSTIDGNLAWSAQAFARPNLLRDNLLGRISYDLEQRWQVAFEWLVTPADRGSVSTASLVWNGNRQRFACGLRELGGAADSAYARAPVKRMAYLQWSLSLP